MAKKEENLPATTEGADLAPTGPPKTISELLTGEYYQNALASVAPMHLKVDRFIRMVNTSIVKNPKLRLCTPESFWNCMVELTALGLEPNGREAHLIPYGKECTLIVDYKGLIECINRSGDVSYMHAELVCDNDDFLYDMGQVVKHVIDFKNPRGEMYAVYSHAKLKDGNDVYEIMPRDEVEKVREMSASYRWAETGDTKKGGGKKDSTWHKWQGQMWRKSAIRRHSNTLPFSSEVRKIIQADDRHLYPDIDKGAVSGADIRAMSNGTRMKIKKEEPIVDAEVEEPVAEEPPAEDPKPEPEGYQQLEGCITKAQAARLYAIGKSDKDGHKPWPDTEIKNLILANGYEHTNEIPKGDIYDNLIAQLEE